MEVSTNIHYVSEIYIWIMSTFIFRSSYCRAAEPAVMQEVIMKPDTQVYNMNPTEIGEGDNFSGFLKPQLACSALIMCPRVGQED